MVSASVSCCQLLESHLPSSSVGEEIISPFYFCVFSDFPLLSMLHIKNEKLKGKFVKAPMERQVGVSAVLWQQVVLSKPITGLADLWVRFPLGPILALGSATTPPGTWGPKAAASWLDGVGQVP